MGTTESLVSHESFCKYKEKNSRATNTKWDDVGKSITNSTETVMKESLERLDKLSKGLENAIPIFTNAYNLQLALWSHLSANPRIQKSKLIKTILFEVFDSASIKKLSTDMSNFYIETIMNFISCSEYKIPETTNIFLSADNTITIEAYTANKSVNIIFDITSITAILTKKKSLFSKGHCEIINYDANHHGIIELSEKFNRFF